MFWQGRHTSQTVLQGFFKFWIVLKIKRSDTDKSSLFECSQMKGLVFGVTWLDTLFGRLIFSKHSVSNWNGVIRIDL